MAKGFMGKVLFVDLSKGKLHDEMLSEEIQRDYLGGYGIGAKIIFERQAAGVDPLGPDNFLAFMTGPLTGTPALIGSRYTVMGKSPLTSTWGDANSGGDFGPGLKFAGYDGVFFTGVSAKPVYLLIENGKAELRDAGELWGKDTNETEDMLRAKHGKDVEAACIGPSGETLSLISCVINNRGRAAGRSGLGALMGSKRLKAIAVRGNQKPPLADEDRTKELRKYWLDHMEGEYKDSLQDYGQCAGTADLAMTGDSPVKNWGGAGTTDFPTAQGLNEQNVIKYETKKYACYRCPLHCGGIMNIPDGPYAVKDGHKPEYETLASFGTLCLIDSVEAITKANEICNKWGLDTISAGTAIAFAIECYENGLISKADTGGIELRWGDADAMLAMLDKLARREGFGDVLADGVRVASQKIGLASEEFAVHVNGQEPGMHDPKFEPYLGLTYQFDATPARHCQGGDGLMPPGIGYDRKDKYDYTAPGRGYWHKVSVNLVHVANAAGLCLCGYTVMRTKHMTDFLSSVCGWEYTQEDLLKIGERINNVRHLFNLREGIDYWGYKIPGRLNGNPPLKEGNVRNVTVDVEALAKAYLKEIDWDEKTLMPSDAKLKELGLETLAAQVK
ncbi:MAG: aldehyde ferredoxin oxidoreductase family protein [Chloroflexi bacterium]|nr:aldehyde ferredoxin oxidoreductase family protein [Chloroflexota bacterium]